MARTLFYLIVAIGILALIACPAQAFTAKTLDIVVAPNGDATITFDYDLNWFENAAVFTRIADPSTELKKALEDNYGKPVDVIQATGSKVQVVVHGFAAVNGNTVATPALSFQAAERVLKGYWFAPLITVDFSPEVTTVVFPDGYTEQFTNQIAIPRIVHTMG